MATCAADDIAWLKLTVDLRRRVCSYQRQEDVVDLRARKTARKSCDVSLHKEFSRHSGNGTSEVACAA